MLISISKDPAAARSIPNRSISEGRSAPRLVSTMPKTSMPRQAAANTSVRLYIVSGFGGEGAESELPRTIQARVSPQGGDLEGDLGHANRLPPAQRLVADAPEQRVG